MIVHVVLKCLWYLNSRVICFLQTTDGNKFKGGIYMVFEYMDHDLTGLADRPGLRFTVPQIKVLYVLKL